MSTYADSIAEMIRRTRLAQQFANLNDGQEAPEYKDAIQRPVGVPGMEGREGAANAPIPAQTPAMGTVQPPTAVAGKPDPRQTAIEGYRQSLNEDAPDIRNYHPSFGRRLAGGILGGIAGMHDGNLGAQVGEGVVNGPFNKEMSAYQQKLAKKKALFDAEEGIAKEDATISHLGSQGRAEEERAGAEKARRESYQYKMSPEYRDAEQKKWQQEHPIKMEPVRIKLKNGESINGVRSPTGEITDPATKTVIGFDAIDKLTPLETKDIPPEAPKTFFDENRGMVVNVPPGGAPVSTPVPGMTPKPVESPEDKAKRDTEEWNRRNGITSKQADARAATNAGRIDARQESAAERKDAQVTPGAKARGETAKIVLPHLDKIEGLMNAAQTSLGTVKGKWSEMMTGKLGAENPAFSELRSELKLLSAAVTQMHTGARGGATYLKEFNDLLSAGGQNPENLKRAIKVTRGWAKDYADVSSGKKSEASHDEKMSLDELLKK